MDTDICPIRIEHPVEGAYWKVLRYESIVALCPTEFWALSIASALLKQHWETKTVKVVKDAPWTGQVGKIIAVASLGKKKQFIVQFKEPTEWSYFSSKNLKVIAK